MHFERTERRTRQIQLTPLIDVVFLLIIFFMLSTTFIRIESMELGLPGNGEGGKIAIGKMPVLIDIVSTGGIYWQREMVLPTTLRAKLDAELKRDPNRKVLVRSGKGVSVQKLVSVLDSVYLAGVKDVAVDKWDERDLPQTSDAEEEKAIEKALEREDINTPVLKEKQVKELPTGPYSVQEQLDEMLEEMRP